MEIPSLPTDNLYKFMALTGLLGIVLIVYYYENTLNVLKKDINAQSLELKLLSSDTMLLNVQRSDINQRLLSFTEFMAQNFPDEVKKLKTTNEFIKEYKENWDSISALNWMYYLVLKHPQYMPLLTQLIQTNTEYKESAHRSLKALKEYEIRNNSLNLAIYNYHTNKRILKGFLVSSMCLTILGFGLWYLRVQVYQDQILKNSIDIPDKKKKAKSPD